MPLLESFAHLLALELEEVERAEVERRREDELQAQRASLEVSERRFRSLALATAAMVWTTDTEGRIIDCPGWSGFTGQDPQSYAGWGWLEAIHAGDRERVARVWREALSGMQSYACEYRLRRPDGRYTYVLARGVPSRDATGVVREWVGAIYDISARRQTEALLEGQRQTLELIGHDEPLDVVLEFITELIERHLSGRGFCSILLNEEGRLRVGAAPHLPPAYIASIEGLPVGPTVGSCGTAVYRRAPVIAADIEHDPLWADYRDVALAHGLRACWSTPILSGSGEVLGAFAIYPEAARGPVPEESELVRVATYLAGIAIERSRIDAGLKQRAAALAEADQRKDEFLAMLAHELRNPLAPIMTTVELLRRVPDSGGAIEQARGVLDRQARHLARLVDDLLDVSRITRGKAQLRRRPSRLEDAITHAVEIVRPLIDARGHDLGVQVAPGIVADIDADRIAQVFANLLNNAAKFTPPGGRIEVEAVREGHFARITVRDEGMGIPRDKVRHIFELFVQGDATLDRPLGGLGIGLTLVRDLVEMHGGTVTAHSDGPGCGSEFTVRLPVSARAAADLRTEQPLPGSGDREPRRILVVDDNVDAADTLAEVLRMFGDDVWVAYDGHEALAIARDRPPDVVLLDIGLPGIDGYEVARRLRARPEARRMRIVALTGYGQAADRQRALEAGFDEHVVKPVDVAHLEAVLAGPTAREARSPSP